jgi:hypothetical protein
MGGGYRRPRADRQNLKKGRRIAIWGHAGAPAGSCRCHTRAALFSQPMTTNEPALNIRCEQLTARIAELEAALTHIRAIADAERRRAARAEESAERAWRLIPWGTTRRDARDT